MGKKHWDTAISAEGYMTLEASFILPVAIILIAGMMVLGFYLYTVVFLNQAAYIAAFRASISTQSDKESVACQAVEDLLEERILAIEDLETNVTVSLVSVQVEIEAALCLPAPAILGLTDGTLVVTAEKKAYLRDPASYIRSMRLIT